MDVKVAPVSDATTSRRPCVAKRERRLFIADEEDIDETGRTSNNLKIRVHPPGNIFYPFKGPEKSICRRDQGFFLSISNSLSEVGVHKDVVIKYNDGTSTLRNIARFFEEPLIELAIKISPLVFYIQSSQFYE